MMNPQMYIPLSLFGQRRPNLLHVLFYTRFKNRQEDVKFTINVAKCDKFFDELLKMTTLN
jgi:hypothetical protein